jgi:hypothetical protein
VNDVGCWGLGLDISGITMDQRKKHHLVETQTREKILAISEFDFPFPKFHILPKEGTIILRCKASM